MFERTIDCRDPTCGNARIACRRLRLGMSEKGLDITKVGPLLEQFCREGMSKGMQADRLGNAGGRFRFMKEAAQLAVSKMLTLPTARLWRCADPRTSRPRLRLPSNVALKLSSPSITSSHLLTGPGSLPWLPAAACRSCTALVSSRMRGA